MKRLLPLLLLASACFKPAVKSFDVAPVPGGRATAVAPSIAELDICAGERVQAHWKVRGHPAMVLRAGSPRFATHEDDDEAIDPLAPDTLELTMIADPGPNEAVKTTLVLVYPDSSSDRVAFYQSAVGDTLVSAGEKSRGLGRFAVARVTNTLQRDLEVRHAGRAQQVAAGATSSAFLGTSVDGHWEIRALMSAAERASAAARPDMLAVDVTMTCTAGAK